MKNATGNRRLVSLNPAYDVKEWPINSVRVVGVMIGGFATNVAEAKPETRPALIMGRKTVNQLVANSRYGKRAGCKFLQQIE